MRRSNTKLWQRASSFLLSFLLPAVAHVSCRTPLNKIAEPEEVAIQVAFLASHRVAGHTTGQVVMIHGGMEGQYLAPMRSRVLMIWLVRREVVESKAVIGSRR